MNLLSEGVFKNGVDSYKLYGRASIREDTSNKRGIVKGHSFTGGRYKVREVLKMTSEGRALSGGLGGIRLGRVYGWDFEYTVLGLGEVNNWLSRQGLGR